MDVSAALTMHIHGLSSSVDTDQNSIYEAVVTLTEDLRKAVWSYLGLELTLVDHGHATTLTVFDPEVRPEAIATSLGVSLSALGVSGASSASSITFYAGTPGAFVDLAEDLVFALGLRTDDRHPRRKGPGATAAITVDDDRRPATLTSGLVGTEDLSIINRAVGMLIGEGLELDEAHTQLGHRAQAAGLTILALATQLVRPDSH